MLAKDILWKWDTICYRILAYYAVVIVPATILAMSVCCIGWRAASLFMRPGGRRWLSVWGNISDVRIKR